MKSPWEKIGSEVAYRCPYWKVKKDKVIQPDGKEGYYYFVDKENFVSVIAMDDEDNIYLTRQWRYIISKNSWETPQGLINEDEDFLDAAKRELKEETGIEAKEWENIGFSYLGDGLTNQAFYIFLAKDLNHGEKSLDNTEQDMITEKFSIKKVEEMIKRGGIFDSPTITSLHYLKLFTKTP